jgi:hypothetical protein
LRSRGEGGSWLQRGATLGLAHSALQPARGATLSLHSWPPPVEGHRRLLAGRAAPRATTAGEEPRDAEGGALGGESRAGRRQVLWAGRGEE